jgi:hypothetical protein
LKDRRGRKSWSYLGLKPTGRDPHPLLDTAQISVGRPVAVKEQILNREWTRMNADMEQEN